jgi:hypothetical protein
MVLMINLMSILASMFYGNAIALDNANGNLELIDYKTIKLSILIDLSPLTS